MDELSHPFDVSPRIREWEIKRRLGIIESQARGGIPYFASPPPPRTRFDHPPRMTPFQNLLMGDIVPRISPEGPSQYVTVPPGPQPAVPPLVNIHQASYKPRKRIIQKTSEKHRADIHEQSQKFTKKWLARNKKRRQGGVNPAPYVLGGLIASFSLGKIFTD